MTFDLQLTQPPISAFQRYPLANKKQAKPGPVTPKKSGNRSNDEAIVTGIVKNKSTQTRHGKVDNVHIIV